MLQLNKLVQETNMTGVVNGWLSKRSKSKNFKALDLMRGFSKLKILKWGSKQDNLRKIKMEY